MEYVKAFIGVATIFGFALLLLVATPSQQDIDLVSEIAAREGK